jgi:uncharacterized protein
MSDTMRGRAIEGFLLMLGFILGGWILGSQIKAIRLADRYVTVKGLVERNVKSDLAIWPISFKESGANLQTVLDQSEKDKGSVLAFLKSQGFTSQEVSVGDLGVTDRLADLYSSNAVKPESRFVVSQTITLTTKSVDRAGAAGSRAAALVRAGVVLSNSGVSYRFTGLNSLKPDMITEATRNARAAATRFAQDSGSEVGPIRSANQGVFSISAASAASGGEGDTGDPGTQADSSMLKKIRVVTTVDYYLVK